MKPHNLSQDLVTLSFFIYQCRKNSVRDKHKFEMDLVVQDTYEG